MIGKVITILKTKASHKSLNKAIELAASSFPLQSIEFRGLDLTASEVCTIVKHLSHETELRSVSFSYNVLLSDAGAVALSNNLPDSVKELGLVNCEISDEGGLAILGWMKSANNLSMICVEQNQFSDKVKSKFQLFESKNTHIIVVV